MKTRLDTAESPAEPNRPTLVSHARTRRRGMCGSTAAVWLSGWVLAMGIITLLLGGIDELFQIAPEDLILGAFYVAEIVFLDGKDEDADGGQRHTDAGENGDPGQLHRVSWMPTTIGRRALAACWARSEILASFSTFNMAAAASAQPHWAGHQPWRRQRWRLVQQRASLMSRSC